MHSNFLCFGKKSENENIFHPESYHRSCTRVRNLLHFSHPFSYPSALYTVVMKVSTEFLNLLFFFNLAFFHRHFLCCCVFFRNMNLRRGRFYGCSIIRANLGRGFFDTLNVAFFSPKVSIAHHLELSQIFPLPTSWKSGNGNSTQRCTPRERNAKHYGGPITCLF